MTDWIETAKSVLAECNFKDYTFKIDVSRTEAVYLQATYLEADTITGNVVRHSCDRKSCFNYFHLLIGTPKQNTDDRDRRGRQARGITSGNSKLTEMQVRAIRAEHSSLGSRRLAQIYGVGRDTIGLIVRGDTWKHLL